MGWGGLSVDGVGGLSVDGVGELSVSPCCAIDNELIYWGELTFQ